MSMESIFRALVPAAMLAAVASGALAQAQAEKDGTAPQPTRDALMGALNNGADGMAALQKYLGSGPPSEDLVKRVDQLLDGLRGQLRAADAQTLLTALDRIVGSASASLNAGHIVPLDVDPLNVSGATVPFNIAPTPGAAGGGRTITFQVPNGAPGPYRVLILIRNPADSAIHNAGFGNQIGVNGAVLQVHGELPPNPGLGEALVVEAVAVDGKISIHVPDTVALDLSNIAVERADEPSRFITSPESLAVLLPFDVRLAIEGKIQALAASFLNEVATTAGPQLPSNPLLPEPAFQPELTASPS